MPWKPIDFDPTQKEQAPPTELLLPQTTQAGTTPAPGGWERTKSAITGAGRTEFPKAPEFSPEYTRLFSKRPDEWAPVEYDPGVRALTASSLAADEAGQLDILKKSIPDLEQKRDKFGNLMLKTPRMPEWTYLNKPGLSARDVTEFAVPTAATAPLLGWAGGGRTLAARLARSGLGLGAASAAQDIAASAAGSEQGVSPERAIISGGLGAAGTGIVEPLARSITAMGKGLYEIPASRIRSALNPNAEAARRLRGAYAADQALPGAAANLPTEAAARAAQARGQDVRVMDLGGETMRAEARRAANLSPAARAELHANIEPRFESQGSRFGDFLRNLVQRVPGRGPNAFRTAEELARDARLARKPLYDKAYQDGAKGLTSPVLERLMTAPDMPSAFEKAQRMITTRRAAGQPTTGAFGPTGAPTLETWDLAKRALDDKIATLKRTGARAEAQSLDGVRRELLNELDKLVPSYAPARGTASGFFRAEDALGAGQNFVRGNFPLDQTRDALARMTAPERTLFAEGFASKFIDELNRIGDRRSILNTIAHSPTARAKLEVALGANRARALETYLRWEGIMDLARKAMGNSTTVRQLAELGLGGYGLYNQDPYTMALAALSYGGRQLDRRIAERIMQQLMSTDIATFMRGVRQVASTPILDSLRRFDEAVVRLGIGRTVAAQAGGRALGTPETGAAEPPRVTAEPSIPGGF